MDRRLLFVLPVLAFGVWYVWEYQGGTHKVEVDERATQSSYDPFSHWMTMRPGGYVRHFPDRVGPACLVAPVQNEDQGALSTSQAGTYAVEEYAGG